MIVIPAQAGIQFKSRAARQSLELDPRICGGDEGLLGASS